MSPGIDPAFVWLCLAAGAMAATTWHRPTRQLVGGLLQRDRKGRLTLVLAPVKKRKRKTRRGRRRR